MAIYQEVINKLAECFLDDNEALLHDMQVRLINTEEIASGINIYGQIHLVLGYLMDNNHVASSILPRAILDYVELIVGNINDHYSIIGQSLIEIESLEPIEFVEEFDPFAIIIDDYVWHLLTGEVI